MMLAAWLPVILTVLGVGFLIANVRMALELARWRRRRRATQVVWMGAKPPFYGLSLAIGTLLGVLLLVKAYLALREETAAAAWALVFVRNSFGELMMFVYFGYMLPLSTRIARGLYSDGIWTDTVFLPYEHVKGIAWRDGAPATLLVVAEGQAVARRLGVPAKHLGEVRRVLRDKMTSHAIETADGPGLHLGARDARDSV
ncbi:MAG: hypothetical protein ACT4QD_04410 [Acidobacteriota bacterium]